MNKDSISGIVLAMLGIFVAVYSQQNYSIGTFNVMGPGFFPFYLGIILCFVGLLILITNYSNTNTYKLNYFSLIIVSSSVLTFALLLNIAGLIITTVISVLLSTYASNRYYNFFSRFASSVVITFVTYIIFVQILKMNIPIFPKFL